MANVGSQSGAYIADVKFQQIPIALVDSRLSCHVCRPTVKKDMADRTRATQINEMITEAFGNASISNCSNVRVKPGSSVVQMICPFSASLCVKEENDYWTARYCGEKVPSEKEEYCDLKQNVTKCVCADENCNPASLSRISPFLLPFASLSWMATRFLDV
ncbi:unnamed protein product [Darwinula stevensoni]|uniref:Uncharacterized protein n=1 Tax=Darwinula stevensoni TaxID=69355 RepID=A0A7R8X6D2_9CRUS|nr:unnamed protein product [Darwinula stevensoni]CAG0886771.1 unnamed protein product [Darwinula stevensoni]